MAKTWTDAQIRALPPKAFKYPTNIGLGLYVMTYPSGSRKYCLGRSAGRSLKYDPLPGGDCALMALAEAMQLAGHASQRQTIAAASISRGTMTLGGLRDLFLAEIVERRSVLPAQKKRVAQVLQDHFLQRRRAADGRRWAEVKLIALAGDPDFAGQYAATLYDAQNEATALSAARGPSTLADKCDEYAQQMFEFAALKKYLSRDDIPPKLAEANQPRSLDRALSPKELESLLGAPPCEVFSKLKRHFARLQVMTGLRAHSLATSRWRDIGAIEPDVWTVQVLKKTKSRKRMPRPHHLPIMPMVRAELDALQAITGESGFLFPQRYWQRRLAKGEPITSVNESWAKHIAGHPDIARIIGNLDPQERYAGHAFRRTTTKSMISLGIRKEIAKLACGHQLREALDKTYFDGDVRPFIDAAFMKYHAYFEACAAGEGVMYLAALRADVIAAAQAEIDQRREHVDRLRSQRRAKARDQILKAV